MYFFEGSGSDAASQYIEKTALGTTDSHLPKGRKFYLHHGIGSDQHHCANAPWKSHSDENDDQKMKVRPIQAGAQFRFRIHFENITKDELKQLVRSMRPAPEVRFKLGLGKPLGLGTVRLDPSASAWVLNVKERYSLAGLAGELRSHIEAEQIGQGAYPDPLSEPYLALHARKYQGVSYPQVAREGSEERECEKQLFEWFVANDTGSGSKKNPPRHRERQIAMTKLTNVIEALEVLPYNPPTGEG